MSLTAAGVANYLDALNGLFASGNLRGSRLVAIYVELAEDPEQEHIDVLYDRFNEARSRLTSEEQEEVDQAVSKRLNTTS